MNASPLTRSLLYTAVLAVSMGSALAATGRSVWPKDESKVTTGMTMEEVRQALGKPSREARFKNKPGPIWTYTVDGVDDTRTVFEVEFSADGKVISTDQRTLPPQNSHPSAGAP